MNETYHPGPGEHINTACSEAIQLAQLKQCSVEFVFNDIKVVANPNDTVSFLSDGWQKSMEDATKAYWTPERLAEQESRNQADRDECDRHCATLEALDCSDLEACVRWLVKLAKVGDNVHVKVPAQEILKKFAAAGYAISMNLKDAEESLEHWRDRVGRDGQLKWLIGQGMAGVALVGAPHGFIIGAAEDLGITGEPDLEEYTQWCKDGMPGLVKPS